MGAITRIRQISPVLLGAFLIIFLVFMGMQDCSSSKFNQGGQEDFTIGTVNGVQLKNSQYQQLVEESLALARLQDPNNPPDDDGIRRQVFNQMINDTLLKIEAQKMGIHTSEELERELFTRNIPEDLRQQFLDSTGNFMQAEYERALFKPEEQVKVIQKQFEGQPPAETQKALQSYVLRRYSAVEFYKKRQMEEILRAQVGAGVSMVSPTFAEWSYITDNSTADVSYVAIPADRISNNDVKVSAEEIKAYYERTKDRYKQLPERAVSYINIPLVPSAKDSAKVVTNSAEFQRKLAAATTIEDRNALFTQQMSVVPTSRTYDFTSLNDITDESALTILKSLAENEVFGPINVNSEIKYLRLDGRKDGTDTLARASHILIRTKDNNKDSAKAKALRLLAELRKGEDFAKLAMENSEDPGSGREGGDLRYFRRGAMVGPFDSVSFSPNTKIGEVYGPVETVHGYHLIKVTDRVSTQLKYSEIVYKPVLSPTTRNQLNILANNIEESLKSGKDIDSVATSSKLRAIKGKPFASTTPYLNSEELSAKVFAAKLNDVIRMENKQLKGIVIVQVKEVRERGSRPLEDVKAEIERKLITQKKLDKLKSLAEQAAAAAQAGGLSAVASIDSTFTVVTVPGMKNDGSMMNFAGEFAATNAALNLKSGEVSKAVRGNRAWFVMQAQNIKYVDKSAMKNELQAVMQNQAARSRGSAYNVWMREIRQNAEIVDLRGLPRD